jgi:hypothetical protein
MGALVGEGVPAVAGAPSTFGTAPVTVGQRIGDVSPKVNRS